MEDNFTALKKQIHDIDISGYYKNRIHKLQEYLALSGLDVAICMQPQNVVYLTGFNPILFSHPIAVIIPRAEQPFLLLHCLRANHARHTSQIKDLQLYGMWGKEIGIESDFISALRNVFQQKKLKSKRIAYEGDYLPVNLYNQIKDVLDPSECVNISPDLIRARMIKDSYECALIRLSAKISQVGMSAAVDHVFESEASASAEAEAAMRKFWAKHLSEFEVCGLGNAEGGAISALWCYCNNGIKTAFGCGSPGAAIPQKNTISLPTVWACVRGYYTELERPSVIGTLPPYYEKALAVVLQARNAALNAAKAGISVGELYNIATQIYLDHGFGDMLPERIGHGLGLSIHEQPSLERNSPLILQEGMVITIEPGLMFPEWGALRYSDTVIVHRNGPEVVTGDT